MSEKISAGGTARDSGERYSDERSLAAALHSWVTGAPAPQLGRSVWAEAGADHEAIVSALEPGDLLLSVSATGEPGIDRGGSAGVARGTVVGRATEPGDLIHLGRGFEAEFQDALALPFLAVTRPTLAEVRTAESWAAFFADADLAYATGAFVPQLAAPGVVLAESAALARPEEPAPPARFTAHADGTLSIARRGPVIGRSDDPAAYRRARTLAEEIGEEPAASARSRPWVGRYLRAARLDDAARPWRYSGFGGTLTPGLRADPERTNAALVRWRDEEYEFIAEDGRTFRVPLDTAYVVDTLLETRDPARAAEVLTAQHPGSSAERAVTELIERFRLTGVPLLPVGSTGTARATEPRA